MESTRLSSKGQVIIPKRLRDTHGWESGLEFDVIDTPDGLLLRPRGVFRTTSLKEVAGCLREQVSPRTDAEIAEALSRGIRETWRAGR